MIFPEEINMKKILSIIMICFISIFFVSCENRLFEKEEARAERILRENLRKRYNEEFVIFAMGKRSDIDSEWYECMLYPAKYAGTNKEYDEYYWGKGFVELKNGMEPGDTYGKVLLNEGANTFYEKKLEELFGKNYLAVINMVGYYEFTDFEKEMERRKPLYKEKPDGNFFPISGGIYIFGRVENDEDREWYRTQIYEFVRFLKETGTFEYVDLPFYILDERCLTDRFEDDIGNKLVEARNTIKLADQFIKYRDQQLSFLDNDYKIMEEVKKIEKINAYNRGNFLDMQTRQTDRINDNKYSVLYHTTIYSPKFLENQPWRDKYIKLEFNSKDEVQFYNTIKINYGQYDETRLYNNKGVD
jgi:hypothetical protein